MAIKTAMEEGRKRQACNEERMAVIQRLGLMLANYTIYTGLKKKKKNLVNVEIICLGGYQGQAQGH